LTYRPTDRQVGISLATTSSRAGWRRTFISAGKRHERYLVDMPWGLISTSWAETDCCPQAFVRRAMQLSTIIAPSLIRPYGLQLNTNFESKSPWSGAFQVCLFYGIYPSMFSADASTNTYWDDPALYNRDRPLFQRYIPLIRRLNVAGWQPLTYASTSDSRVYIERFGEWPDLYFTLRNTTDTITTVTVTLQANALGLPAQSLTAIALLSNTAYPLSAGTARTLKATLAPQASEILVLSSQAVYLPLILKQ
jgi:hypothetical protein